jgi:hypothetical protein
VNAKTTRRGLPILLAGLGLFAYQALSPKVPRERTITYRYPAAEAGTFEVRWMQNADMLGQARFTVTAGQRQSSHAILLTDGDYRLETELPTGAERTRSMHVDAETFTVVLE